MYWIYKRSVTLTKNPHSDPNPFVNMVDASGKQTVWYSLGCCDADPEVLYQMLLDTTFDL